MALITKSLKTIHTRVILVNTKDCFRYTLLSLLLVFFFELSGVWFFIIGTPIFLIFKFYVDPLVEEHHFEKTKTAEFFSLFWDLKYKP